MAFIRTDWPDSDNIDWNKKFKEELKGELTEEVARKTLGKFLMYNIGFLVKILTGITLAPYQRLMIKGWFYRNFILTVAGRGASKSTMASIFAYLYCLFNPNTHVLIVSATFRSSRRIVEVIDGWSKRKEGRLLRQTFAGDMTKKQDLYSITFNNGAKITAVPLGNSDRLRGFRCNVLVIDEGLLIPQQTIDLILKPFLIAGADITEKQSIREREDRLITAGKMKEEDRMQFKSDSKMIILSSASYKWEYLFTIYQDYLKKIDDYGNGEKENVKASYLVQQFSYKIVPEEILDPAVTEDVESGSTPQGVIDREYNAKFTDGSDGYFSPVKMNECTIPSDSLPCIEVVGEKDAEYILSIDPNVSSSPTADHFAMCVLKIVNKDGKRIPLVVHQYAYAGCEVKYHILYFLYLLQYFRPVYIAVDTSQGSGMDFINICNESEIFKKEKMDLLPIEADFGKLDYETIAKQVKQSYNLTTKRIVQKQYFHSDFQKAANEYLKTCIDFKRVLFASKSTHDNGSLTGIVEQDIGDIYRIHPAFQVSVEKLKKEKTLVGTMYEFVEYQSSMIDLVKKECATIEPKSSVLGNVTFDMPQSMKRQKGVDRPRRDSYSALFLGVWAFKIYEEMREANIEKHDNAFEPEIF